MVDVLRPVRETRQEQSGNLQRPELAPMEFKNIHKAVSLATQDEAREQWRALARFRAQSEGRSGETSKGYQKKDWEWAKRLTGRFEKAYLENQEAYSRIEALSEKTETGEKWANDAYWQKLYKKQTKAWEKLSSLAEFFNNSGLAPKQTLEAPGDAVPVLEPALAKEGQVVNFRWSVEETSNLRAELTRRARAEADLRLERTFLERGLEKGVRLSEKAAQHVLQKGRDIGEIGARAARVDELVLSLGRKILSAMQKGKKQKALNVSFSKEEPPVAKEIVVIESKPAEQKAVEKKGIFGRFGAKVRQVVDDIKADRAQGIPLISIHKRDDEIAEIAGNSVLNYYPKEIGVIETEDGLVEKKAVFAQTENFRNRFSGELSEIRKDIDVFRKAEIETQRQERQTENSRNGLSVDFEEVLRVINDGRAVEEGSKFVILKAVEEWVKIGLSKADIASRIAILKARLARSREVSREEVVVFEKNSDSRIKNVINAFNSTKGRLVLTGGIVVAGLILFEVIEPGFYQKMGGSLFNSTTSYGTVVASNPNQSPSPRPSSKGEERRLAIDADRQRAALAQAESTSVPSSIPVVVQPQSHDFVGDSNDEPFYIESLIAGPQESDNAVSRPPLAVRQKNLAVSQLLNKEFDVRDGDSFFFVVRRQVPEEDNWINSANGIKKGDVIADMANHFLSKKGKGINVKPNKALVLDPKDFNGDELAVLEAALKTKSADQYIRDVYPEFKKIS